MKIILDTNFLMIPHQFGIDIYDFLKDYEISTLSLCIDELKKLAKKKGDNGIAAKVALELIKKNKVNIIRSKGKADKAIIDYAVMHDFFVGTNDKEMIEALKEHRIKIIRLKQSKYLTED
jgi:rRNA-processing protein FCF1